MEIRHIARAGLMTFALALSLSACGGGPTESEHEDAASEEADAPGGEGVVAITPEQIRAAGITLARPTVGGVAGAIEVPATIVADPQAIQIVSASIGGRLVSLNRNLGQPVSRGDVMAVVESREAAQLAGDVEAARARLALANSNLAREERLFAERVSPEQDLIAARTAATEARIALRQAEQALGAAGTRAGALNRIAIRSPISGQVIARPAILGQTVAADAELFRVANLSDVAVEFSLDPDKASAVRPGSVVEVTAPGRRGAARVTFVSPALDLDTRLVPAIAELDNGGRTWRVGETVQAAVQIPTPADGAISVPQSAVQTVEAKPVVFVRTASGFRAVRVTLGARSGANVVIRSGLAGDERIAVANSFTLKAELGKGEAEHGH
jgi:cobalt-zinc-cadmium efflux system membrane fusion protein